MISAVAAALMAIGCGGGDDAPTGPTKGPAGVFPGVGPASSVADQSNQQATTTLPDE